MKKFIVRVLRSTEYAVEAKDADSAIDAVVDGEGDEVSCTTLDMNAQEAGVEE